MIEHMIYLSIPKGMEFKQITHDQISRDTFVDPQHNRPPIELQELVKKALRENTGRKTVIHLKEFTIYTRQPPNTNELFLRYHPNHNGKFVTKSAVTLVEGRIAQKFKPQLQTRYGEFWDSSLHMTLEKKRELLAKRKEQRQDRRHVGDSPKPT